MISKVRLKQKNEKHTNIIDFQFINIKKNKPLFYLKIKVARKKHPVKYCKNKDTKSS
jgi:hypothetical protein